MKDKKTFTGYGLNDRPTLGHLVPLSLQHVLLFIAGSLAVGVLVVSSLVRMYSMLQHRRRTERGEQP